LDRGTHSRIVIDYEHRERVFGRHSEGSILVGRVK
jgi:hypothetical protein